MQHDRYGEPIGEANTQAAQAIDDFIHGFLAYHPKATHIIAAADANPQSALANAYAAMLWMFLEAPEAAEKAAPYLKRAKAAPALPRADRVITALERWAADDIPDLIAICEAALTETPRDMVMLKLGQYHLFNIGDAPAMLRLALIAKDAAGDIAYTHSMIAFGYEQCHLLDKAENAARHAMSIEHSDPWAHHAIAHVMLTQGRVDEGVKFLEGVAPTWADLNSFMRSHNWWHLALFYLSQGRQEAVRQAYDTHVWGLAKEYSQDQVGAVSLLARMEFAGVDVQDRWADVADHVAARGVDLVNPFLTLQYLYALARTERDETMPLLTAIEERAADQTRFDHSAWCDAALPAARGILAYAKENWDDAISDLSAALPRMAQCGGSHAQRDLFEQIHLDALIKGGHNSAAQQVLEMRRIYDPDGAPLNRQLAQIYRQSGLPQLAEEAGQRANKTLSQHRT